MVRALAGDSTITRFFCIIILICFVLSECKSRKKNRYRASTCIFFIIRVLLYKWLLMGRGASFLCQGAHFYPFSGIGGVAPQVYFCHRIHCSHSYPHAYKGRSVSHGFYCYVSCLKNAVCRAASCIFYFRPENGQNFGVQDPPGDYTQRDKGGLPFQRGRPPYLY